MGLDYVNKTVDKSNILCAVSYTHLFYSILNEGLINMITEYMDDIKNLDSVTNYPASSLPDFMDRYGGMVYRMLSLSELNSFCM